MEAGNGIASGNLPVLKVPDSKRLSVVFLPLGRLWRPFIAASLFFSDSSMPIVLFRSAKYDLVFNATEELVTIG